MKTLTEIKNIPIEKLTKNELLILANHLISENNQLNEEKFKLIYEYELMLKMQR
jgi:hypothetical protein